MNKPRTKRPGDWRDADPEAEREARRYSRPVPSRALILAHLTEQDGPCSLKELQRHFNLSEDVDRQAFERRLQAMLRDGQLVQNRRGAVGPARQMALIAGSVIGHRDGFGFLKPDEGGDDIFLPPRQMRSLMHGDRALIRISGT
ncbi:MAG: ribonuclease R, partial [Salinisphaeraceae bacterium]|nr:ribonuclease R [Salinisphaeraceae bacterium]